LAGGRHPEKGRARMAARCLLALCASFVALFGFVHGAHAGADGLQRDVVFTEYSPLSSNSELLRRLSSPLAVVQAQQTLAHSGKVLAEQPINLSEEKFVVYVPPQAPPHGYALMVFVPPWQDARLPEGWATVLDQYGVIFVSAARSGNDESVLGRREPLALLAAQNIIRRYAVDPERVYIAGFSGGSGVAMRLALGYPDVFRGALLNAGGDSIGGAGDPAPPPKDLFLQFQSSTRLIYVTGENDSLHLGMAIDSMRSMQEWCVFNVEAQVTPRGWHEVASSKALSLALHALLNPEPPEPNKLVACRSAIERELTAKVQHVESLIQSGNRDDAQKSLIEIDRRFGGLAAPRSVDLSALLK
jgi:dienelactone hydrolase